MGKASSGKFTHLNNGVVMAVSIYVGNLPFSTNEDEIRDLFAAYGAAMRRGKVVADNIDPKTTSVAAVEDVITGMSELTGGAHAH